MWQVLIKLSDEQFILNISSQQTIRAGFPIVGDNAPWGRFGKVRGRKLVLNSTINSLMGRFVDEFGKSCITVNKNTYRTPGCRVSVKKTKLYSNKCLNFYFLDIPVWSLWWFVKVVRVPFRYFLYESLMISHVNVTFSLSKIK